MDGWEQGKGEGKGWASVHSIRASFIVVIKWVYYRCINFGLETGVGIYGLLLQVTGWESTGTDIRSFLLAVLERQYKPIIYQLAYM